MPVLPASEIDDLPRALQLGRQLGDRLARIDSDGEQLLIQRAREVVFPETPAGGEPIGGDKKDDGFAARRRLVQRPLPALARRDAALGIEIEKDVVPAFRRQPIAQRDSSEIVGARMAEKDARHRGNRRSCGFTTQG
ncbi:MAG: hypothetical protein ABR878_08250 [Roseiarcus sp.]